MATKIRRMSVRFLRQEDIAAIERVNEAASTRTTQVDAGTPYARRMLALNRRAKAIATSSSTSRDLTAA